MEFCPSNLFQQVLEAKHRSMIRGSYVYQPPAQTLDWLGQIFLGLEHMHIRLEILFRDAWLQLECRHGLKTHLSKKTRSLVGDVS